MKPIKYGLILLAVCYIYFSGAVLRAQAPDERYEYRAQEVIKALMRVNGLTGWDSANPAAWPTVSFNGGAAVTGRVTAGVRFNQDRPARLIGLRLANSGLYRAADFSGLTALEYLEVPGNALKGLNLESSGAITRLSAMKNELAALDIRGLGHLRQLSVGLNQLTQLDLAGNPHLAELSVSMNQLTRLDVSGNPELQTLEAMNNRLDELWVTANPKLVRLMVSYNQLNRLEVGRNPLLAELGARDNQLTRLDLGGNPALEELAVGQNQLTELDLGGNPNLERLSADQNLISVLDLSRNPELEIIDAHQNPLVEVRLGQNSLVRLKSLNLMDCRLPLSRLHKLSGLAKGRGRLGPQESVLFERITIKLTDGAAVVDLSSEAVIDGEKTAFTVLNEKKRRLRPSEYTAENGLVTFKKPGLYMVMMTNPKVFSSEINQTTGRVHAIKAKAYTGIIEVVGPGPGDLGQDG